MPQGALVRRATLFIHTGPHQHLHVVMNDPAVNPINGDSSVAVVNFCSYDPLRFQDGTCLLRVGDHTFIKHPSYVDYQHAALMRVEPLARDLADPASATQLHVEPVTEELYRRILLGLRGSDRVERKVTRFLSHIGVL